MRYSAAVYWPAVHCLPLLAALHRTAFSPCSSADHLGSGYGMPSSHAQFVGFFAAFFLAHFSLHHPRAARPRTLVNTMRIAEHALLMLLIALGAALTAYSRCVWPV